eukprot:scaffold89620_cov78-Phaeocystis_antarctica.AAC.4
MPEPKPTDRNDNNRPTTALEIELAKHIVHAAWSKCPLGGGAARLLHLLRVRLAALGSSALPGCGPATGRQAHRMPPWSLVTPTGLASAPAWASDSASVSA